MKQPSENQREAGRPAHGSSLFRKEALDYAGKKGIGQILLALPISATVLSTLLIAIVTAVVAFTVSMSFTKRVPLAGALVPVHGVESVFSQPATVLEIRTRRGQKVKKGDVLFVVAPDSSLPCVAKSVASTRNLSVIDSCSLKATDRAKVNITATQDALTTEVRAQIGEHVQGTSVLATLVADGSPLEAELYLPTRLLGQIRAGAEVAIRYPQYPYQQFGVQRGKVESISDLTLSDREMAAVGRQTMDPVHIVRVSLARQDIASDSAHFILGAGTKLDASIEVGRRRIIEWMFHPISQI